MATNTQSAAAAAAAAAAAGLSVAVYTRAADVIKSVGDATH